MLFRKRDREREDVLRAINARLFHIEAMLTQMAEQGGFYTKDPKRQEAGRRAHQARMIREAKERENGLLAKPIQDPTAS